MIATWIAYSLIVTSCAACIALAADVTLRAARRSTRWMWASVFVAGAIIPALVAVRPRLLASVGPVGDASLPEFTTTHITPTSTISVDTWLGMAWVIAAVAVALVLLVGLAQLSRARRRAERGILAGREVALTTDLGPGALPFGNPKILVPRWASSLPPDAARLLVLHEEEHVKAGDARVLMGAAIVLAAMPWNVVLWWSLRRLRTAIELDCDARVLRGESSVAPYAELLLQVAGRGHAAPALLALTDSTSQLKTRIDAMTVVRELTPVRRAALGALSIAALVVACETRRPDPVAPVTEYVTKDGRASATLTSGQRAESVKVRAAAEVARVAPGISGDSTMPLLIIKDASGQTLHVARLARTSGQVSGVAPEDASEFAGLPPDDIATVDIVKRGDLLPGEARNGLITVVLKPGATWRAPSRTDSKRPWKSDDGTFRRRAAVEQAAQAAAVGTRGEPGRNSQAAAGIPSQSRVAIEEGSQSPAQATRPIRVVLQDADGTAFYEGPFDNKHMDDGVGPYRFSQDAIDRVEVYKPRDAGAHVVTIRFKEGARVVKR